jgi:VIT1/CCC1 family predicted Fe2+/Mn2+ transporter/rubrerythrin
MSAARASRTDANLQVALAGEADANRRYIAYGFRALQEGRPEIAQLFFEAAGAETIHALAHLHVMGAVGTTRENLERAATGEMEEIEVVLPRMIREAEEDGRPDAAGSFRLALERERHHRDMFRQALATHGPAAAPPAPPRPAPPPGVVEPVTVRPAPDLGASGAAPRDTGHHPRELQTEPARVARLGSIREVVFGAQDGLVSTLAVVAGLAAAGMTHLVVLLGGAMSAVAGVLSMSIGTFLSSRAERQVYEAELARERREIREHPGEEVAELMAALVARGMSRSDAVEVTRRVARHPDLLLTTLGVFELGLAPQRLGTPGRDALVMGAAFALFSALPLLPFVWPRVMAALGVSAALAIVALFLVGVIKGRLAGVAPVRSGLEVVGLGAASALVSFGIGRLASLLLGIEIG